MPPLLVGMLIVGFGTSVPEMVVSLLASLQHNSGVAIGNAIGSNISNIALILGLAALIRPIKVDSHVLRHELPILTGITLLAGWLVWDLQVSRLDGVILLVVFALLMTWTVFQGTRKKTDALAQGMERVLDERLMPLGRSVFWLVVGLLLLIVSSRLLVWAAVTIAKALHVDDLFIGLTVVAVGTSLPELASSIVAARRGEHDIALGNILGSNLFNTLAVVGLAGVVSPLDVGAEVMSRDFWVMFGLTASLFAIGFGLRRPGRINRFEGLALLVCYVAYTVVLIAQAMPH